MTNIREAQKKFRLKVQVVFTILSNGYLIGFAEGKIYRGISKRVCVPGLNCYSCPGAVASCPIGSLQAVLGSKDFKMSFYLVGFLMVIGSIFGRFICGWFCPFGLEGECFTNNLSWLNLDLQAFLQVSLPSRRHIWFLQQVLPL